MSTATTDLSPVLHIAGPMLAGIQRCQLCPAVLADESRVSDPRHRPGSWRYDRGGRVLQVTVDDLTRIQGPYPEDARLPPKTRPCTASPTSEKSTR